MKLIELTQGLSAMVDDSDYDQLKEFSWYALKSKGHNTFYALSNVRVLEKNRRQSKLLMHRIIMNAQKGQLVDHIDGNGLNNQRSNLRIATVSQNAMNKPSYVNSTSKYKGVSLKTDKRRNTSTWRAALWINKKSVFEKSFTNEIDAALAYNEKAIEYFGEFAVLNNIDV